MTKVKKAAASNDDLATYVAKSHNLTCPKCKTKYIGARKNAACPACHPKNVSGAEWAAQNKSMAPRGKDRSA